MILLTSNSNPNWYRIYVGQSAQIHHRLGRHQSQLNYETKRANKGASVLKPLYLHWSKLDVTLRWEEFVINRNIHEIIFLLLLSSAHANTVFCYHHLIIFVWYHQPNSNHKDTKRYESIAHWSKNIGFYQDNLAVDFDQLHRLHWGQSPWQVHWFPYQIWVFFWTIV